MEERGNRAEGERAEARDGGNLKHATWKDARLLCLRTDFTLFFLLQMKKETKTSKSCIRATHQIPIQSDLYGILRGSEGKME